MTDFNVKLDPQALQQVLMTALLTQIDAETRDAIVQQAVEKLLEEAVVDAGRWGEKKKLASPLQEAFNVAISRIARSEVDAYVDEHPEVREMVRAQVAEAMERVKSGHWRFREIFADAIAGALRDD